MENTFPFQVDKLTDPESKTPYYCIQASVGDIDGYPDLFEEYGFGGNGYSWAEHIQAILNEREPDILEQLEFDEEGDTFLVRTENEETMHKFISAIQPVFGTKKTLKKYLSQADPDDFEE
ncbi:Imm51 family immunity protein [Hymenobacter rubidus]|uniref:Imm51 family immunity protein n=1 Tax=Hymenobacter rubidus TaxID=1441626 RepID=UPI00191F66F9|nr:Imm51 family immunity protein [Hymenobacter rubidus]